MDGSPSKSMGKVSSQDQDASSNETVAPAVSFRRPSRPSIDTRAQTLQSHITPPMTPLHGSAVVDHAVEQESQFHNYLRAFAPFNPLIDLAGSDDSTLMTASLKAGDMILVHSIHANGWADGTVLTTGEQGWLPTNYCEPYEHPYLRNLLNALTQFWDLLGGNQDTSLSTFVRQDYIRGLIAGVRTLLECADCLHRDTPLVRKHTGVRRMRKGLLADLSSLVQIAKRLQDTVGENFASNVVHVLIDDLMSKAFKVVTRAVGFVDIWTQETACNGLALSPPTRDSHPITPPVDLDTPAADGTQPLLPSERAQAAEPATSSNEEAVPAPARVPEPAPVIASADILSTTAPAAPASNTIMSESTESKRQSTQMGVRPVSAMFRARPKSVTHRVSLIGSKAGGGGRSENTGALASEQLAQAHDMCISHIGAYIGHQLHTRPSHELADTTCKLIKACERMLAVVDEVCSHDNKGSPAVLHARNNFREKLDEAARSKDVLEAADANDADSGMSPVSGQELIEIGTGLIRTAGECVAKTRSLIEQLGDFEVENPLTTTEETRPASSQSRPQSAAQSASHDTNRQSFVAGKPLPRAPSALGVPITSTGTLEDASLSPSVATDAVTPSTPFSAVSNKALPPPPVRRHSVKPSSQGASQNPDGSRNTRPARIDSATPVNPPPQGRKNSVGLSIAGSTHTIGSSARDSAITAVSEVSTRATTPDHAKEAGAEHSSLMDSFASLASVPSNTNETTNETEADDAESHLLQRTYASELTWNKDGQVSGGSLAALVEQLTTHDSTPDVSFVSAFYITFRLFTTPREFAQALIDRFDYIGDSTTAGTPVRLRICNIFKGWLETYWNAEADKDALGDIRYFALHKLRPVLPSVGERLVDLTKRITAAYANGSISGPLVSGVGKLSPHVGSYNEGNSMPEPIVSKSQLHALRAAASGNATCTILDFEPLELARQSTLLASKVFCDIHVEELVGLEWTKKGTQKAPNVRQLCSINTDLAHVVADSILAPETAKLRALVIKHWSKVAKCCLDLSNYETLMAITCSLNSSVVQRLKRTWQLVSKNTRERLDELNTIVDFSKNQQSLRRRLEHAEAPCLPFLGMFLTDLTFVDAGNPKTRELPGCATDNGEPITVINFDKHMRTAKIIGNLQRFQVPYRLQPVPEMQAWMKNHMERMRASTDEVVGTFHRRSLIVEPKQEDVRSQSRAANPASSNGRSSSLGGAEDRPRLGSISQPESAVREKFGTFLKHNGFSFKSSTPLPSPGEVDENNQL